MKKNQNKPPKPIVPKIDNEPKANNTIPNQQTATAESEQNAAKPLDIKMLILPIIGILAFLIFWFEPIKPTIVDDWNKGAMLLDSANKVQDPVVKQQLLDQGGKQLKLQVQKHPYHARIWYLYGYYHFTKQNWDSCIAYEKKAIEIGAGGVVNNVEFAAADILNAALTNKLNGKMSNTQEALAVVNAAQTPNFKNTGIDKLRGMVYSNSTQLDSSIIYLGSYLAQKPNDFDALFSIAIAYFRMGNMSSAKQYALKAVAINPNNPNLNNLLAQIK